MRERIEKIVRWAFLFLGVIIIGSCTAAGGSGILSGQLKGVLQGLLGGVLGFLGGLIVVGIFFGWAYTYLSLQRDLKKIHAEIATLRAEAKESGK